MTATSMIVPELRKEGGIGSDVLLSNGKNLNAGKDRPEKDDSEFRYGKQDSTSPEQAPTKYNLNHDCPGPELPGSSLTPMDSLFAFIWFVDVVLWISCVPFFIWACTLHLTPVTRARPDS